MISKEKMDFAVRQVVNVCLKALKGEKSCVITDNKTKHIGIALAKYLKEVTGNVKTFVMEDFGARPEDGSNPLKFPKEIGETLKDCDVSIYAAGVKKGELQPFRLPMLEYIKTNKKLRHAHMICITDKLMEIGVASDYNLIAKICKQVLEIVSKAKKITVTTAKGTNFTAAIDPLLKWTPDTGLIEKGHLSNIPAGEVFTCPQNVNGKVVVDGVLGDYLIDKYGIIEKTPLILEIDNGYVTSIVCNNKELEKEIKEYASKCENANKIGEIGIGTNIGLTSLVGNLLQDEKFPGVHIAIGDSLSNYTGANWKSDVHLDMVIQKTTIDVDGKIIMKDGKFLL